MDPLNVDANAVIRNLGQIIAQHVVDAAMKDAAYAQLLTENQRLQGEIAELSAKK